MKFAQAFTVASLVVAPVVEGFLPLHVKTTASSDRLMDRMLTTRLDRHDVVVPIKYINGKTGADGACQVVEKENAIFPVVPPTHGLTLTAFLEGQKEESLASVFDAVQWACKDIAQLVRTASFEDSNVMGLHDGGGSINVQGEEQKKLDVMANDILKMDLSRAEAVQTIASEEEETPISRPKSLLYEKSYIVAFDPLDGSSNIDVGIPVGTIFGIFEHSDDKNPTDDVLQPGRKLVGAGYCLYSAATTLVITVGDGVHGFTLNEKLGEFVLTHPNMKIPSRGKIYSFNEGHRWDWDEPVRSYVTNIQKGLGETKSKYSGRLVGSMVADIHRTLQYGGIFGYPASSQNPNGKLRLLYEAAPMSFIVEQAGGKGTTGTCRLMEVQPEHLHQRVPCILGSPEDVEELQSYYSPFTSASLNSKSNAGAGYAL